MLLYFMRHLFIVGLVFLAISFASLPSAQTSQNALREVVANVKDTRGRLIIVSTFQSAASFALRASKLGLPHQKVFSPIL